jgi:gluconokinase
MDKPAPTDACPPAGLVVPPVRGLPRNTRLTPRYAHCVVIVLTGAAGSGKTTIGRALSAGLGWRFIDGDDYHAPAAIAKMRAGRPLTDAERAPWLAALHREIAAAIDRRAPLVVACSALRERYRRTLRGDLRPVRFVFLEADEATLQQRLEQRTAHFAGPSLVASQLATLEPPESGDVLAIDATCPPPQIVERIRYAFGL